MAHMTAAIERRVAHVGGCEIHYLELGAGPSLLFLHGSGGLRFDEATFSALARDFHLSVPSMPGFDQSSTGSVSSGPEIADVIAALIRDCAGGRASVIGESFGGRIAAWLTIRHPEVVDKSILAAPGGLRRSGGDRGLDLTPEEQQMRLYGRKLERQPTPEQVAQRKANVANAMRYGGPPWDEDLYQQLPNVTRPVLVLYGSNDQTLARADIELFHERIHGSRIVCIDGAPHVLSATYPDQFVALAKDFLGS